MTYKEVVALPKEDDSFKADWLDGYEQGRADAIDEIKNIIANYHAHIDDDAMADIFSDLEFLRRKANDNR